MKKLLSAISALLVLVSCQSKDDYTGEPFLRISYTVDGEPFSWEDWGETRPSFLGSYFAPESEGSGLLPHTQADSSVLASFTLGYNNHQPLDIYIDSNLPYFTENTKYSLPQQQFYSVLLMQHPGEAVAFDGWFSFSRKVSEPFGCYSMSFCFDCATSAGDTLAVRDGNIEVYRRFTSNSRSNRWSKVLVKQPIQ